MYLLSNTAYADEIDYSDDDYQLDITAETSSNINTSSSISSINSRSYIVLDRLSNTILLGKNQFNKVKMASTTKIMTAIIVLENSNLNQIIEVSKKAANTGGSRVGLKTGDKITIKDLLYGLMLCSGNDAAVALAETVGGNIEGFSKLMNSKAHELNLTNTNFESPHGLDSDGHYTTAYELAILSNYALKNEIFLKIVGTKNHTITVNGYPKNLSNTNELLGHLNGVYGIKTGFTNGANRCLVSACKRNDMDIICVVLGADTKKFRTQDSIKLIEYTFNNFEYINIQKIAEENLSSWKLNNLDSITVTKGEHNFLDINMQNPKIPLIPILKDNIKNIHCYINIHDTFNAPINRNDILGNIEIAVENKNIIDIPIISATTIKKKNFYNYFFEFFKNYTLNLTNNIF